MPQDQSSSIREGLARLKTPVLPLIHIVQWLYLSGPFQTVTEMLPQLSEPIEMEHGAYAEPAALLAIYSEALGHLHNLKKTEAAGLPHIEDEEGTQLDSMEAISQWTRHLILNLELETINSLLCAPQHCTLCCTGPEMDQEQLFFDVPLQDEETSFFDLLRHDDKESRATTPYEEPPLTRQNRPFYTTGAGLYHWQNGWSLILPKGSRCPHLDDHGACCIYPRRPTVCRKPQIFPYLLERAEIDKDGTETYILRNKILAVWDCPYVRAYKEEIETYAELCGLEPVFRQNKK
ncbi:MAG: YkgJ family cysteine cluster protein [Deltaproteobacteria bacterium]